MRSLHRWFVLFGSLCGLSPMAFAQTTPAPASDAILLGAGVRSRPAYDGASAREIDLVPVVRYYGRPWFARTTFGLLEGGVRTTLAPGFVLGAQLAYEPARSRSESQRLRDLDAPDIDASASIGVHAAWRSRVGPAPVGVLGRVRRHLDTDNGAQADLRLVAGVYGAGRLQVSVFTQATFATKKSNQVYYGSPGYAPDAGLVYLSLGAQQSYALSRAWLLVGGVEARRLQGDVAKSPLVERGTSYYAGVGVAYRF